jgi:hypothetical protein
MQSSLIRALVVAAIVLAPAVAEALAFLSGQGGSGREIGATPGGGPEECIPCEAQVRLTLAGGIEFGRAYFE